MSSGPVGGRKAVEAALIDYHRTPGKYSLLLRRPEILFTSIKEVLQLASGRLPDGAMAPGLAVQRAAGFFVRTALLYPAADHYALLGLERSADMTTIKERYRQMMRLTHPDFASSAAAGGSWPADAASRINQAYEVLASVPQRRRYDETLDIDTMSASHRPAAKPSMAQVRTAAASAPAPDPRRLLRRIAGAFGILAALALMASLFARGPDGESLVQRTTTSTQPPEPSAGPLDAVAPPPIALTMQVSGSLEQAQASEVTPMVALVPSSVAPEALDAAPVRSHVRALPPATLPAAATVRLVMRSEAPAVTQATRAIVASSPLPAPTPSFLPAPAIPAIGISIEPPSEPVIAAPAPLGPVVKMAPTVPPSAAPAPGRPILIPAVTMAEAHLLLSTLLQQMESGSGERLLSELDRSARNAPGAQALARQFSSLVEGAHSVKVSNVLLKADPREDRLLVTGQVLLDIGVSGAARPKELALEAEFAKRDGAVVMTRLAPARLTGATAQ